MKKSYRFFMQHRDHFLQIADFDGFDTRLLEAMLLEHTRAMVLDMINNYKYILDFTRFSNSQQRANIHNMVTMCKALTKQVVRQTDTFMGYFFNLMISLPWYVGWQS